ncbi:MAG: MATE family efflux transporter [Bacilli bacterium]
MNGIDMTTGSIVKKISRVAFPILVTNLINMAHNLTDMFWLGQVSQTALSAVGAMGLFLWLGISVGALSRTGSEVMVSQEYGKKNYKKVNQYATNGLMLTLIVAFIYGGLIFVLKSTIINAYNFDNKALISMSYDYLKYIPFSVFFTIVNQQFISTYNGTGNSKIVFIFVSLGLVANMFLDPLFILILDMGANGAGIATLIAMLLTTIMFGIYSRYKSVVFENFRVNTSILKTRRLINLGIVPMLHQILFSSIFIIMSMYIVKFGDENVAISRIGSQVESMIWIVGAAATTALTVYTGQNFGVKDYKRVAKGFAFMYVVMVSYSFLIAALFIFHGETIFKIFLPNEPETIKLGAIYLLINAPAQIFIMSEAVATGFFNGQGYTKVPAFASIFGNLLRVPLMILLGNNFGINGVWVALAISASIRGVILIVQFFVTVCKRKEYKFRYFILNKEVNDA